MSPRREALFQRGHFVRIRGCWRPPNPHYDIDRLMSLHAPAIWFRSPKGPNPATSHPTWPLQSCPCHPHHVTLTYHFAAASPCVAFLNNYSKLAYADRIACCFAQHLHSMSQAISSNVPCGALWRLSVHRDGAITNDGPKRLLVTTKLIDTETSAVTKSKLKP